MASFRNILRTIPISRSATFTSTHTRMNIPRTAAWAALAQSNIRAPWSTHSFSTGSASLAKRGRPGPGQGFQVNFVLQDGEEVSVQAHEGESLLDVAWANDIDIEGACEASLACSTCHLILDEDSYGKLEEPTDEENDMLDLAFGLTDTSRLGCQVLMNKDMDGIIAKLPTMTRNAQA